MTRRDKYEKFQKSKFGTFIGEEERDENSFFFFQTRETLSSMRKASLRALWDGIFFYFFCFFSSFFYFLFASGSAREVLSWSRA